MGALAPITPWVSKDDLLLKNAIEAGASLESLAKGAVQFSRRFTIKELQDRWLALLYDPIISVDASARMVEFERSQSTLSAKSNKTDNSKKTKCGNGKRKSDTVRRCYYVTRKRICYDPLNPGDLSFLVAPGDSCFTSGAEAAGPVSILGGRVTSHFGLEDANFDNLHHVFPQVMRDRSQPCCAGEFPTGRHGPVGDATQQTAQESSHMVVNNVAMTGDFSGTAQGGPTDEFQGHNIFESNECETSLHHLQYVPSPPAMPVWKNVEGMPVPEMHDEVSIRGSNIQTGGPFCIPDDGDAGKRTSECGIHSESKLNNHMSCTELKNATGCAEGYFAELSDCLLNFTSDDDLIIDGEKDIIDKTYLEGLNSLLLSSPNDVNEEKIPDVPEVEAPTAAEVYHCVPTSTGPEEKGNAGDTQLENSGNISPQSNFDAQMPPPASSINPQFSELRDGVICCMLNAEDPEIPCNDDIVLPSKSRPSLLHRRTQSNANNPSFSGKDTIDIQANVKGLRLMSKDAKLPGGSQATCQTQGLDVKLNHSVNEFRVKVETSGGETFKELRMPSIDQVALCQSGLAIEHKPLMIPPKPGCKVAGKTGQVADLDHVHTYFGGMKQDGQTLATNPNQELYNLRSVDPIAVEPGGESLLSDPEEHFSDSDSDVPYFSDIESMILDMELGPEDLDSLCSPEVAKYQHENSKRKIIRLEQNAHSYMQRALASHGAFAILYGRHSKHYIKKPEVLLGRATDDFPVDIDLGREGHANKISRRQALIKMENDGTFSLRNLGKCSIYVNSKEIFPGQALGLHSNCLLEIRGMPFIFEFSQSGVKKYLGNAAQKLESN